MKPWLLTVCNKCPEALKIKTLMLTYCFGCFCCYSLQLVSVLQTTQGHGSLNIVFQVRALLVKGWYQNWFSQQLRQYQRGMRLYSSIKLNKLLVKNKGKESVVQNHLFETLWSNLNPAITHILVIGELKSDLYSWFPALYLQVWTLNTSYLTPQNNSRG